MTNKPNSGTRELLERVLRHLEWFGSTASKEVNELRAMLAEQRIVCSNGILCQSTACEECGGNGSYKSETRDQSDNQYPEGKRERFQKWVLSIEHPVKGWLDGHWLKRGDDGEGYADEYVQGLWVAFKALGAQQGEPAAWQAMAVGKDGEIYRNVARAGQQELTLRDARFAWGEGVLERFDIVIRPLFAQPATAKVDDLLHRVLPYLSNTPDLVQIGAEELAAEIRAKLNGATKVVLPDCMNFTYEHRDNKERHTVSVSRAEVIEHMDEQLYVKLTAQFCQCEPIGETNVVECRCNEYTEEFELVPDAGAASTTVAELQARLDLVQAENAARMRQAEIVNDKYWSALKGSETIAKELDQLKARGDELASVVKLAREFVKNGIELGYITMPDDDAPDPAHDLLPRMDAVLGNDQT